MTLLLIILERKYSTKFKHIASLQDLANILPHFSKTIRLEQKNEVILLLFLLVFKREVLLIIWVFYILLLMIYSFCYTQTWLDISKEQIPREYRYVLFSTSPSNDFSCIVDTVWEHKYYEHFVPNCSNQKVIKTMWNDPTACCAKGQSVK